MESEQKNIFLAIALSVLVLVGFNYFYKGQDKPKEQISVVAQTSVQKAFPAQALSLERPAALMLSKRAFFETREYKGSVHLKSGALDDLVLKAYTETVEPNSALVKVLNPKDSKEAEYIEFVPQEADTAQDVSLNFEIVDVHAHSLRLISRGSAFDVERIFTFGKDYRIHVEDLVTNKTPILKKIRGHSAIFRVRTLQEQKSSASHEGLVGVLQGKLEELNYKKLDKVAQFAKETDDGWIGFTDRYFMTSLLLKDKAQVVVNKSQNGYLASTYSPITLVQSGQTVSLSYDIFSGPKELKLLEKIETLEKVRKFDLAVDFGWLYFLTKPLFKLLTMMKEVFNSFAWALIVITVLAKVLLFPMGIKAHRSMQSMKSVQQKIENIRARYPDDKVRQQQEIMQLYKKENIKPAAGCLPILLQIPIFFCLYKVLHITIEMRHAPFLGWVKDLSMPDTLYFVNAFGALNFTVPHMLQIGLWPVLMGITMFIQQKTTPTTDPAQEKAMLIMPFLFTFLFAGFPVGVVIYWTISNILSIIQQWLMTRYYSGATH